MPPGVATGDSSGQPAAGGYNLTPGVHWSPAWHRPGCLCGWTLSAMTRSTIAPTVCQLTRHSSATSFLEAPTTNRATVSSKAWVCPAPCRAQGTAAIATPSTAQDTLGRSASR